MTIFSAQKRPRTEADACDFLCAGAQKAGTTWLWANLGQHPQVKMPLVKEVHYFDRLYLGTDIPTNVDQHREAALACAAKLKGAEAANFLAIAQGCDAPDDGWYRRLFAQRGGKFSGDITPAYLCLGLRGVQHVQRLSPNLRVIILVRDPQSRMTSGLAMSMARNPGRIPMRILENWQFQERGNYAAHIPIWDHIFGDQVRYIPFGRIRTAPRDVLAEVEAHIGLMPFGGYENPAQVHNSFPPAEGLAAGVLQRIEQIAARQSAYLLERFGADFCAEI